MTAEILLVDDNKIQAETRRMVLLRSGRSVAVAGSAAEALKLLEDEIFLQAIRLIISDHWMPGMNGPEFVRRLRAGLPRVPVLVLSGLPDAEAEYEGMNVVFRIKPMAPEYLIRLSGEMLNPPVELSA
jgi:CheY-like chemotaxis protein